MPRTTATCDLPPSLEPRPKRPLRPADLTEDRLRLGNEFTGTVATLTIRANDVRIVPARQPTEAGPSHRVYAGRIEIGAAWSKKSRDGKAYLSLKLDDPSLIAPVYASLLADENGRDHNLVWSRGSRREQD